MATWMSDQGTSFGPDTLNSGPEKMAMQFGCHPGVQFSGDALVAPDAVMLQPSLDHTIFVVARDVDPDVSAGVGAGFLYVGSAGPDGGVTEPDHANSTIGFLDTPDGFWVGGYGQTDPAATLNPPLDASVHIFIKVYSNATANGFVDTTEGAPLISASAPFQSLSTEMGVGGHWSYMGLVKQRLTFTVAEILVYDAALDSAVLRQVRCALALEYGAPSADCPH